jgi:hypothetical protein
VLFVDEVLPRVPRPRLSQTKQRERSHMIPTLIIIGADKGGVGKTTIARALVGYLAARGIKYRAFDCEAPAGDLKRFAPEASIIDIAHVPDQMRVFDGTSAGEVTVLDLRGGLLSPTLRALDEARLLDDIRKQELRLILLHVLGPTMSSIGEISSAARSIGGGAGHHLVVKNHINQTQFFEWDAADKQEIWRQMANVTVDVPQLSEIACETLQKLGGSFAQFVRDEHPAGSQSRTLRGRVETWLETVWAEFDRVGIATLIAA